MRVAPLLPLVANGKEAVQKLLTKGERLAAEEDNVFHNDNASILQ
eukprot:SAG31_NODE_4116_length_3567_cov_2.159746_5_plen_45_part_00